jgi:GntR family transcriptional regulator
MLTSELGTSLYHRVFLVLRDQIDSGRYPPGSILPSELEVCREFGVSRVTSRRAMAELEAAGVVFRQQGRGTFVRENVQPKQLRPAASPRLGQFREFVDSTTPVVHEFDYLPAPERVRDILGEDGPRTLHQRAVRVRKAGDRPLIQVITWVREKLGRHWTAEDLGRDPVTVLVRRAGVELSTGSQTASAVLCDPLVSERLDVEVGAPLLRIERVLRDRSGQAHVFVDLLARPDRFQLHMDLEPGQL